MLQVRALLASITAGHEHCETLLLQPLLLLLPVLLQLRTLLDVLTGLSQQTRRTFEPTLHQLSSSHNMCQRSTAKSARLRAESYGSMCRQRDAVSTHRLGSMFQICCRRALLLCSHTAAAISAVKFKRRNS